MKFKTNFKDMREAVVTIGKAVKKNMSPIEISLVKIEAGEDYVELSTNGSIGACVKIQAVVEEAGSFVTSFSGINILSVRKCDGDINASNEVNENTLVLKYRGGKAKTELAAVDKVFNSVANPTDDCANVSLPYASLKSMCKDTVFAADDNVASDLHAIKVNIMDDTDGLLKFTLAACDGKSIAVRTAYAVKEGAYTGEILILPDVLKISLEILETEDENVKISIGNGKLFMETENARTCFPVLDKNYPDLNRILNAKKCSFTASIKKDASVVSADNTGNNECGKCKNGLSMFPVYVGFTVVCSYMMNRLIALSYTWDSKLQRVMSNFHYVLSFKANRKLFLNALSLPDNTTNNNGLFQIAMYLNNNQWQKVYDNAGGSQWYFAKIKKAVDEILKVGDTHLTLGVVYQGAAMLIPIALIIVLGAILLLKGKKLHGILVLVCAGLCAFGNFGAVIFIATMLILGELLSIIVDSSLAKNKDLFDN